MKDILYCIGGVILFLLAGVVWLIYGYQFIDHMINMPSGLPYFSNSQ